MERIEIPHIEGATSCEVFVAHDQESWGAHDTGHIRLPHGTHTLTLPIAYDEREAPHVTDDTGSEKYDMLISLTDEGLCCGCVLARIRLGYALVGVGIRPCFARRLCASARC